MATTKRGELCIRRRMESEDAAAAADAASYLSMNLFMVVGGRSLCGWRLAGREEWDALFWREGEGRLNSTHFFGGKSGTIKFDALFWREEWDN